MKVGELSRHSGVSVSMIKYYLREGMLPAGERAGAPNQADYGDAHLRRLRLLRALREEGDLSAQVIKQVLAAVDGDLPLPAALGAAQDAVVAAPDLGDADEPAGQVLAELVGRRGWLVDPDNPGFRSAARILTTAHRLGFDALADLLDVYADAAETVADRELTAFVPVGDPDSPDREGSVQAVVTGIVLGDALLSAVRTMAHQHVTLRRLKYPDATPPDVPSSTSPCRLT